MVIGSILIHIVYPVRNISFEYSPLVFIGSMFISLPITLIFVSVIRIIINSKDRLPFWIKNPSVSCEIVTNQSVEEFGIKFVERLKELSFTYEAKNNEKGEIEVSFSKRKGDFVSGFLTHAFNGSLIISNLGNSIRIKSELIMQDTLIVETGEYFVLDKMQQYLLLKTDKFTFTDGSSTFDNAFVLGIIGLIIWSAGHFQYKSIIDWSYTTSLAVLGLLLFSIRTMIKDKSWENRIKIALVIVMIGIPAWSLFK
jgi:hypothetical protein